MCRFAFRSVFAPDLIRDVLAHLTPSRMVVQLMTVELKDDNPAAPSWPAINLTERWFGTQYCSQPLDADLLEVLAAPPVNPALAMPPRNPFVPRSLALKPARTPVAASPAGAVAVTDTPSVRADMAPPTSLVHAPGTRLWHKQDTVRVWL